MRLARFLPALALALVLAACGGSDDAAPGETPSAEAAAGDAAPPGQDGGGEPADAAADDADAHAAGDEPGVEGAADLDDIADLPFGQAIADAARAGAEEGFGPDEAAAAPGGEDPQAALADAGADLEAQKARMAEVMAAMQELSAAGNDPAKREAAMERMKAAQREIRDARVQADSDRRAAALEGLPEQWKQVRRSERDGPEAELLVQLGDIDNLGFGWPAGFDPFAGKSTPVHRYPYRPEADDPDGTDRIMVVSGYVGGEGAHRDGYTFETARPDNAPRPLVFEFALDGVEVKTVALQLFVDDFQSNRMGSRYRAWLDGAEALDLAATLNALDQTGPIGKLVTLQLLPEHLQRVRDGRLELRIDDPDSDAGDGFAFDFARLLVNPKGWRHAGTVRGIAVDTGSGRPLAGVLVSAANVQQALTDAQGRFVLEQVPAGLVVTSGSKPGYTPDSEAEDLVSGETLDLVLELAPLESDSGSLAEQLERERKVDLYGIYFDTDKATLKPESEETLRQVLGVLQADPPLRLVIAGHTDDQGGDAYNQSLSERRAAAVVAWLVAEGIDAGRLASEGHGESRPVADNGSEAGRALNRRVEVRLAD